MACKEGNASCCQFISYDHINTFEKMLTDDNYIILKYFLHLSNDQQKENIAKNAKTLGKAWRDVSPAIDESDKYDEYLVIEISTTNEITSEITTERVLEKVGSW